MGFEDTISLDIIAPYSLIIFELEMPWGITLVIWYSRLGAHAWNAWKIEKIMYKIDLNLEIVKEKVDKWFKYSCEEEICLEKKVVFD